MDFSQTTARCSLPVHMVKETAAQEEWERWIPSNWFLSSVSMHPLNTLYASNCKVDKWGTGQGATNHLVSPKWVTSIPVLKGPEFVLAFKPAKAAVPGMQVHQQINKSSPSCQGPKQGREEETEWTKCMFSHQSCLLFQKKKKKKLADCNTTQMESRMLAYYWMYI